MTGRVLVLSVVISLVNITTGFAQAGTPIELTLIPVGATSFQDGGDTGEPSFANYDLGGALTVNVNPRIGVEAEVGTSVGFAQDLDFGASTVNRSTPTLLRYTGSVILYVPSSTAIAPFVTAGVGGLTVSEQDELGPQRKGTFLTGTAGGGVKWYANRWGLRVDYRFLIVKGQQPDLPDPNVRLRPDFFGKQNRYGHRLFGGVILKLR